MNESFSELRLRTLVEMHKLSVKLNDVRTISHSKGKFNLCNIYNTIEGCNFVKMLLLCSLGSQLANYTRNLNN